MRPAFWAFLLLTYALFVVYGLALTFWTLNEWFAGYGLNAIFGAWLGSLFFFAAWKLIRAWARAHFRLR